MPAKRTSIHGEWSSRLAFILAATGSAVGLGNIWRFPYITGENGGGAFVLVYLACVALIGIPIMMAEVMLGRRGRRSPINTMALLAHEEGRSAAWQGLGWLGMVAGFLILSFYSVVAGWTLAYSVRTATGTFTGATAQGVEHIFNTFIADPERLLAWHTVFMVMTMIVVSRGVKSGLERAVRYLMPALFLLLVVMLGYALNTGFFDEAARYLFRPDFGKLTADGVLQAMGQAFFSLSLGMGAIMMYGSYLSHRASISKTVIIIASMDTLVAVLAGLVIFPIVFANQLHPELGSGMVFKVLPLAFGQMPAGSLFGTLFFVLLVFAAWTSAISLLEPVVAWLVENRGMNRVRAASLASVIAWVLGVFSLLSLNIWHEYTLGRLPFFSQWADVGIFALPFMDLVDYLTANVMLPLGGMLLAIFSVWVMQRSSTVDEFGGKDGFGYRVWRGLTMLIAPLAVFVVLLNATGLLAWLKSLAGQ